jgi:hypothetical protein
MFNISYKVVVFDLDQIRQVDFVERSEPVPGGREIVQRNFVIRMSRGGRGQPPPPSFYAMTADGTTGYYSLYHSIEESGGKGRPVRVNIRNPEGRDFGARRQIFAVRDTNLSMLAPPDPVGEGLYGGYSKRRNPSEPPDTFAARLDRRTGQATWETFLCMNAGKNVPMFGPFAEAPPVVATFDRGTVYVATNNGACAALEALTGHIRWIRLYPQDRNGPAPAPPLVHGEGVIFAGSDSTQLLCVDRETGRIRWQSQEFRSSDQQPAYVEGIAGDRIVVSGPEVVCFDARSGKVLWRQALRVPTMGKGALGEEDLYIPTKDGVTRVSLADGTYRAIVAWDDRESAAGNLLLLKGGYLTYSERRVNFFEIPGSKPSKPEY